MKIINFWFKGKWVTPILVSLFLLIGALSFWFGRENDQKLLGIISGLITGFIVLVFQVWLSWVELKKMEKFDELRIVDILARKDEREDYARFISTAKKKLWMLCVTAHSFLEDFADEKSTRAGANALLKVLENKVEVRFLIALPESLATDDVYHKNKAQMAELRLKELSLKFANFKYTHFEHPPMHSILTVDDESIVGPIFPGVRSKNTPAIHLKNDSAFVKHYLEYFRDEWKKWSKGKEVLQD